MVVGGVVVGVVVDVVVVVVVAEMQFVKNGAVFKVIISGDCKLRRKVGQWNQN